MKVLLLLGFLSVSNEAFADEVRLSCRFTKIVNERSVSVPVRIVTTEGRRKDGTRYLVEEARAADVSSGLEMRAEVGPEFDAATTYSTFAIEIRLPGGERIQTFFQPENTSLYVGDMSLAIRGGTLTGASASCSLN